jgi:hypothetical protein
MSSPFSSSENPYQSPSSAPGISTEAEGRVSQRSVELLVATRPWVRFISVLLFLSFGLMIIVTSVISFRDMVVPAAAGAMFVYALFAAFFYLVPAVYLNSFANRITWVARTSSTSHLEQALEAQKSFWKYVGILLLIIFALYAILGAIVGLMAIMG